VEAVKRRRRGEEMLQQKPNETKKKRGRLRPRVKGRSRRAAAARRFDPLREIELPRVGFGAGDIWDPSSLLVFLSR
jgi:hypothetical protein